MTTATYTIHDYNTGKAVGEVTMPVSEFAKYEQSSGDTGVITAREVSLMGECVWSEVGSPDDSVYLMESTRLSDRLESEGYTKSAQVIRDQFGY